MASDGEKERDSAVSSPSAAPRRDEPRLPGRALPAAVMLLQGLVGGGGLLTCALRTPVQRFALGTFASVVEVAFAAAILATRAEARKESIRTLAIRYVMVVAVGSLVASSAGMSSAVTGLHIVWSFALLGVLLGEPTRPRVALCAAVLLAFDALFFVGIARHAF